MMTKVKMKTAEKTAAVEWKYLGSQQSGLNEEDKSKDAFFARLAGVAEAMMARHGKEFAIGTLILAARFIAEGKPLTNSDDGDGKTGANINPA